MTELGRAVDLLRERAGFPSGLALAKASGVPASAINRCIAGHTKRLHPKTRSGIEDATRVPRGLLLRVQHGEVSADEAASYVGTSEVTLALAEMLDSGALRGFRSEVPRSRIEAIARGGPASKDELRALAQDLGLAPSEPRTAYRSGTAGDAGQDVGANLALQAETSIKSQGLELEKLLVNQLRGRGLHPDWPSRGLQPYGDVLVHDIRGRRHLFDARLVGHPKNATNRAYDLIGRATIARQEDPEMRIWVLFDEEPAEHARQLLERADITVVHLSDWSPLDQLTEGDQENDQPAG